MKIFRKFLRIFGPGLITGAADDDPSGIATYSQTGAQFGYGQLWTALFMLPFMIAVQEACARIGAVKGKGLSGVIKDHYSKKILVPAVILILIANTINIGADIGAMAAASNLIVPINFTVLTLFFTSLTLFLEIFISYRSYANYLKWLCLSLLAYPLTVLIIHVNWHEILLATIKPHIEFDYQFLFIITGVFGTTISPYMFFWQASEVVEEQKAKHMSKIDGEPAVTSDYIRNIRIDNFVGMLFSEITTWSIIVVAATVLHKNGITDIQTSADAAKALEPFVHSFPNAGYLAKVVFAIGIIGLGLISVPVLAASAAYALSEAINIRSGLNLKLKHAHGFYGIITIATLIGLMINFIHINPIKALVYTAVINGVVAVPLIAIIALIAQNESLMGSYKSGWLSKTFVWLTFVSMLIACLCMFATFGK